jgi:hypothetical protein
MNGYRNIDTYGAVLWLVNDEHAYFILYDAIGETLTLGDFADIGQELLEGLGNPDDIDYSEIDWQEVYEQFLDD